MAEYSVNHLSDLINEQIRLRENLNECLLKAETLASVALSDNFLAYPKRTLHCYLRVLSDVVEKAKELNDQALNVLIKKL